MISRTLCQTKLLQVAGMLSALALQDCKVVTLSRGRGSLPQPRPTDSSSLSNTDSSSLVHDPMHRCPDYCPSPCA